MTEPLEQEKTRPGHIPGKTVLGVTGGVGSGKSRILTLLREKYGACVIEADQVSKSLIEKDGSAYGAIVSLLGEQILDGEGNIRRPVMAQIIFHDPEKLAAVNAILHPATFEAVLRHTKEAPQRLIVYESAIPKEARFPELCDRILYVYTPRKDRLERLHASRDYSEERSRSIMRSQPSDRAYRAMADAVLDNSGSIEETEAALKRRMARWGIPELP